MSKRPKCDDCGASLAHRNVYRMVQDGKVIRVCMDCAQKRSALAVNRMRTDGIVNRSL